MEREREEKAKESQEKHSIRFLVSCHLSPLFISHIPFPLFITLHLQKSWEATESEREEKKKRNGGKKKRRKDLESECFVGEKKIAGAAKDLMTLNDDDDSIISIVSIDHEKFHVMLPLKPFLHSFFSFLLFSSPLM